MWKQTYFSFGNSLKPSLSACLFWVTLQGFWKVQLSYIIAYNMNLDFMYKNTSLLLMAFFGKQFHTPYFIIHGMKPRKLAWPSNFLSILTTFNPSYPQPCCQTHSPHSLWPTLHLYVPSHRWHSGQTQETPTPTWSLNHLAFRLNFFVSAKQAE